VYIPFLFFLPAIIQQFGFSVIISNLLTVPVYGATFFAISLNGIHSDRTSERYLHICIPLFLSMIFLGSRIVQSPNRPDSITIQYDITCRSHLQHGPSSCLGLANGLSQGIHLLCSGSSDCCWNREFRWNRWTTTIWNISLINRRLCMGSNGNGNIVFFWELSFQHCCGLE